MEQCGLFDGNHSTPPPPRTNSLQFCHAIAYTYMYISFTEPKVTIPSTHKTNQRLKQEWQGTTSPTKDRMDIFTHLDNNIKSVCSFYNFSLQSWNLNGKLSIFTTKQSVIYLNFSAQKSTQIAKQETKSTDSWLSAPFCSMVISWFLQRSGTTQHTKWKRQGSPEFNAKFGLVVSYSSVHQSQCSVEEIQWGVLASRVRGAKTYTCTCFSGSLANHRSGFASRSLSRARYFFTSTWR